MFSNLVERVLSLHGKYESELKFIDLHISKLISQKKEISFIDKYVVKKGKRIRSLLAIHAANGYCSEKFLQSLALIELIHAASLMHDDVVDNNYVRRNSDSFFKSYGAKKSILIGDFSIMIAIQSFLVIHDDEYIKKLFLKTCKSTAYGAIKEQSLSWESSQNNCLDVVSLKTASFFLFVSFLAVSLYSNNFEKAKLVAIKGLCFGILFQIQNDLDSYTSTNFNESEDYVQKNITYPLMLLKNYFGLSKTCFYETNPENYNKIRDMFNLVKFKRVLMTNTEKYYNIVTKWLINS